MTARGQRVSNIGDISEVHYTLDGIVIVLSRRSSLLTALALGLLTGIAYPLIDLALACRTSTSEACVWGKAYLPLTLGVSLVLVGGIVAGLAYALLMWKRHPRSNDDAV